jgi:hypothetical protein
MFKAEDGMIVGTTGQKGPNTFLCRGPYGDFVLAIDVLCDPALNSGVQIRSHIYEKDTPQESNPTRIRKAGEIYGYQCEIADAAEGTSGNFWDEARRTRWLDDFTSKPAARAGTGAEGRPKRRSRAGRWKGVAGHPGVGGVLQGGPGGPSEGPDGQTAANDGVASWGIPSPVARPSAAADLATRSTSRIGGGAEVGPCRPASR